MRVCVYDVRRVYSLLFRVTQSKFSMTCIYFLNLYKSRYRIMNINKISVTVVVTLFDDRKTRSVTRKRYERRNIYSCVICQCHELCLFIKHCFSTANGIANPIHFHLRTIRIISSHAINFLLLCKLKI